MTGIDPQVYYDAAATLTDLGAGLDAAVDMLVKTLAETGSMSGTGDDARRWALGYDERAGRIVDNARYQAQCLGYFASLTALAGYNHALADYNADTNPGKGAGPAKPAAVPPPVKLCWFAAPAAGGPGTGLISDFAELMSRIRVHVPDGDTDKLGKASQAWREFAATDAVATAPGTLRDVDESLAAIDSPEIRDISNHLSTLHGVATDIHSAATRLAADCAALRSSHETLRTKIAHALELLAAALTATLVVTILFDAVTAGLGTLLDGAAVEGAAAEIEICAAAIEADVAESTVTAALEAGTTAERLLATAETDLDTIAGLTAREIAADEVTVAAGAETGTGSELSNLFANGNIPKASELERFSQEHGWVRSQTEHGPIKYTDESGAVRITIKQGSPRAPGSADPHVEIRDGAGRRIDPFGNPVTRKSIGNHTPIDWDLE